MDRDKGLYDKYEVTRHDGSEVTGAFVLRPEHDPAAYEAMKVYAEQCKDDYPKLADDLWTWMEKIADNGGPSGREGHAGSHAELHGRGWRPTQS